MIEGLDRNVVAMMKAIAQQETPGGKAVAGSSGELPSRFQYTSGTWKGAAQKYLRDANAPLTPENENKVTYQRIKDWKDKGYKPHEIASMWNAGEGRPDAWKNNKGVNSFGIAYDTPTYVKKVVANFNNNIAAEKAKSGLNKVNVSSAQPEETPDNLLTLGAKGVNAGLDAYNKVAEFTGIPWALRKAGGAIGGAVDWTLNKTLGGTVEKFIQNNADKPWMKSAIDTAKAVKPELPSTGEFTGNVLAEGAKAAPFAGLGKIPSAIVAAPALIEGVKEKDPTKIAIGTLGVLGATKSKGMFLEPEFKVGAKTLLSKARGKPFSSPSVPPIGGGGVVAKESEKLANEAAAEFRTILRPSQGEIKNLEIRQGKNIDDYYRLAAEEKLPIKASPDKKLDTREAIEALKPKQQELHNILNAQLETNPSKQFDLLEAGNKAKEELAKTIKNATDLKSATKDVDEYIADSIERSGRFVSGKQLNDFKSGMWAAGYNMLKPTAQSTARKLGHIAKDMIEGAYDDLNIRELNNLSGRYATLSHLLENANGRVIQGGALGRLASQGIGAVAGSHIPIVGPIAGQFVGGKVSDMIYDPARRALKASAKASKAGIIEKSFKEAKEAGVKSLVEKQPKYPLLEAPKENIGAGTIEAPYRPMPYKNNPPSIKSSKQAAGIYRPPETYFGSAESKAAAAEKLNPKYPANKGIGQQQLYGFAAGIEPYQDDNGKMQIRFNPNKAVLGLGLTIGGGKLSEFFKSSPKAIALLEDLKKGAITEVQFKSQSAKLLEKEGLLNPKLKTEDYQGIVNFIDAVRGKGKINVQDEIDARNVASAIGINPEQSNSRLANAFDSYLTKQGSNREVLSKGAVPKNLLQEARKYKSAEEFSRGLSKKEFRYDDTISGVGEKSTRATVGKMPFSEVDKLQWNQGSVEKSGVTKWKKRIEAGERPYVIVDYTKGVFGKEPVGRIIDGHTRFEAYRDLGIKEIPIIDRSAGKVLKDGEKLTDIWKKANTNKPNFPPKKISH